MNTKMDLTEPEIKHALVLEFLIKRFNESLTSDDPVVPFLLQGLSLFALNRDEESLSNYKGLLCSPYLPVAEIVRRSIEIFQIALGRDPDGISSQRPQEEMEMERELDDKFCRRIIINALREGKIMSEQSDYRFVGVFELLAWIGLQCHLEWLAEFEQVRAYYKNDPENLVQRGRNILKGALSRRRPSDRAMPHSDS